MPVEINGLSDVVEMITMTQRPVTIRPRIPGLPGNEGYEVVIGWGADCRKVVGEGKTVEAAIESAGESWRKRVGYF